MCSCSARSSVQLTTEDFHYELQTPQPHTRSPLHCDVNDTAMNIAVASAALLATAVFAIPLKAQHSAHVTARIGIASPSDAYQSNCGHSSLAYSLDVQGTRRLFPQFRSIT